MTELWPFLVFIGAVFALTAFMLGFSYILGERHSERVTDEPYESGAMATGSAKRRFDAGFYLIAVFFVIFDLEAVFIFAWAVSLRELGWAGYVSAMVFILFLLAGLGYLWGCGALETSTHRQRIEKALLK
jgi:NADH-quinone oxidoreductase subunit A